MNAAERIAAHAARVAVEERLHAAEDAEKNRKGLVGTWGVTVMIRSEQPRRCRDCGRKLYRGPIDKLLNRLRSICTACKKAKKRQSAAARRPVATDSH